MTTGLRHAAALAALIACATPAHAGWETTHWDMPLEEAVAALDGAERNTPAVTEMVVYDGVTYAPLLKQARAVEGLDGEVTFLFDADATLQFVTFSPSDAVECDRLVDALTERHGATDATGFGSTAIYNWVEGEDIIRLTSSLEAAICNLSYGPA
ncbi:MAG: hypothetical protein P0Y65_14635 [Candidatus Devosia phytovorans]|uniref:Uncharacterized protein n=1 Tax=Candidatus Devosia phytovorans TaxID=3121372 RepID=A0AAJ5VU67_9HYPH|nr:hypothetical protein [Devosia sp.]WEK03424.1 MAG: hypothetical protein P0Y65_14635 [Devosia sp.]